MLRKEEMEDGSLLNTAQAAHLLGVSRQAVQSLLRAGALVSVKGAHHNINLFARTQVEKLAQERAASKAMRAAIAARRQQNRLRRIATLREKLARLEGRAQTA